MLHICVWFDFMFFLVTFNHLCCWTQRCGFLSRIQLRLTNQSWQTNPNESVWHFEVVFAIRSPQIGNLVQVVYNTISVVLLKLHISLSWVRILMTLKQIFQLDCIPCAHLHEILKWLFAKICFVVSFMCLSRFDAFSVIFPIYAVERNVVVYCHAYN